MSRCSLVAAGAALVLGGFASAASAQSWNGNCQGRVNLHAVYRNIVSTPAPGEASYHGQFQNQDQARRTVTLTIARITRIGQRQVIRFRETLILRPFEQQSVELLSLPLHEPGGTSTPDASVIRSQLAFSCRWG